MSDTTVRGTVVYTNRLWAVLLGGPRSRTRTTKVNRPCAAVCRDITPQSNTAPQQQHDSALEIPTREGPATMCSLDLGFSRQLSRRYDIGQQLGSGGNAIVYMAQDRFTHKVLACKSIPKSAGSSATQAKTAEHIEAIRREVRVLQQLRGSLNVACLEEVYEDDTHVHLLLEYCKGGELAHRIGARHYSERTVCNC